jgi:hypothetical protein
MKMPFQGKENELKNDSEMEEIIRQIYYNVDKTKLVHDIYYF